MNFRGAAPFLYPHLSVPALERRDGVHFTNEEEPALLKTAYFTRADGFGEMETFRFKTGEAGVGASGAAECKLLVLNMSADEDVEPSRTLSRVAAGNEGISGICLVDHGLL